MKQILRTSLVPLAAALALALVAAPLLAIARAEGVDVLDVSSLPGAPLRA